jgi:lipopolysaccharide transport system permease protein
MGIDVNQDMAAGEPIDDPLHRSPDGPSLGLWTDLLWQFTVRQLRLEHKGSVLGGAWMVIQPLLFLALYTFVFGFVFGGRFNVTEGETRVEFALGVYLGLSIYNFFSDMINRSPRMMVSNPNLIKKVVFPLEILPCAHLLAGLFRFALNLTICLLAIALIGPGLSTGSVWLPFIVLPLAMTGMGLAWLFFSLGVYFRDVAQITPFLCTALLYVSAVFYPATLIPDLAWPFLSWNILIYAIEMTRGVVLWGQPMPVGTLVWMYVGAVGVLAAGLLVFRKLKPGFADVI